MSDEPYLGQLHLTDEKASAVPVEVADCSLNIYIEMTKLWAMLSKLTSNDEGELKCIESAKDKFLTSCDGLLSVRSDLGLTPIPDEVPRIELPRPTEAEYQAARTEEITRELDERASDERAIFSGFMDLDSGKPLIQAELFELYDAAALDCSDGQSAVLRLHSMGYVTLAGLTPVDALEDFLIFSRRLAAIPGRNGRFFTLAKLTKAGRVVLDKMLEQDDDDDDDDGDDDDGDGDDEPEPEV
jgi:hypothetical protein